MANLKNKLVNDISGDVSSDKSYQDWVAKGRPNRNPHKWGHRLGATAVHTVGGIPGSMLSAVAPGISIVAAPIQPIVSYNGWRFWGRKDVNPQGYYAFDSETEINKDTCINPTTPGFTREQTIKAFPNAKRVLKGSNLIMNYPQAFGDTTGVNTYGFSEKEDIKLDNKLHDIPKEVYNYKNNRIGTAGAWGTGGMTILGEMAGTLGGGTAGAVAGGALGAGVGTLIGEDPADAAMIGGGIGAGLGALTGSIYGGVKGYKYGKNNFMRMDVEFDKFYAFSTVEPTHGSCLNEFSPSSSRNECRERFPNALRILKGSTLYALYPSEFSAS